jgi:hypothetical protein
MLPGGVVLVYGDQHDNWALPIVMHEYVKRREEDSVLEKCVAIWLCQIA